LKTFNELGNFNASVSGQEGDAPDGTYARGSASQNTTVTFTAAGGGSLTGSGSLFTDAFVQDAGDATSTNQATVESFVKVIFEVTGNEEPFIVSGEFQQLSPVGAAAALVQLGETSQPPEGSPPISFLVGNDATQLSETTFSSGILSLRPGTYFLDVHSLFGTDGSIEPFGNESGLNSFEFTVGTPSPTSIPLPAGVWAGVIGFMGVAGAVRKRVCR
jgi:hypothetical protein